MERITATYKPYNPNGIFILGEYGEINDWKRGYHFSGGSGQEFKKMCTEAGFNFFDCYHDMVFSISGLTKFNNEHFCTDWPKSVNSKKIPFVKPELQEHVKHVHNAIEKSGATLVIATGDLSLFVLTGKTSVAKWRGSCLYATVGNRRIKVIPTYAPNRVLKVWSWRHIVVYDLKRALQESASREFSVPAYAWHIRPSFAEATEFLDTILAELDLRETRVTHDLETINRYISCSGLGINSTEAMCIPFMTREENCPETPHSYWSVRDEARIIERHQKVLTHPNARVTGQNYLYDTQHIAYYWGFMPNVQDDTMLAWHTLFPGEKKSLDFLASLFCDYYTYWKDELKDYNRYPDDEEQYWTYNCKDISYTHEVADNVSTLVDEAGQREQYTFQMGMFRPVLRAMLRGVRVDTRLRSQFTQELFAAAASREEALLTMSGNYKPENSKAVTHWFNSPAQCQTFFYDYLGLPKQISRATKRPTTDDKALSKLGEKEPIVRPIVQTIQELRSINIFRKNFCEAPLGPDNRIRCSYNLAGTGTFRLASSKDAFGQGANLQTIPSGTED